MKAFNRNFILMIIGQDHFPVRQRNSAFFLVSLCIAGYRQCIHICDHTGGFHTSDHSAIPLRRYSGGSCKQKKHHAQS